jgi:hypothetical protein
MNKRWKFQLAYGIFFGLLMSAFSVLLNIQEISLSRQFNTKEFYINLFVFMVVGIFVFGYLVWKQKSKKVRKK